MKDLSNVFGHGIGPLYGLNRAETPIQIDEPGRKSKENKAPKACRRLSQRQAEQCEQLH